MDTIVTNMWLELGRSADLVVWGPGLCGYTPMTLGAAAEHVDADVVLLPDLHHMIPHLWTELWAGLTDVRRPVVAFMSDPGAAVAARIDLLRQARPAAMLGMASREVYSDYDEVLDELGARFLSVPLGVDPALCHLPPEGSERDVDILVSGAEHRSAYPVRARVKRVARGLAERYRVVDLAHPGYWQLTPRTAPPLRGQPLFASHLRRSRVAVTGTTWGIVSQKDFEAAACGAVGCGDLPSGAEGDPFREATIVIDPTDDDDEIERKLVALLDDPPREETMRRRGVASVAGCSLHARGEEIVAAIASVVRPRAGRRTRPFPAPPEPLRLVAAPEPESVPDSRLDWVDIWTDGGSLSRTRATERALAASSAEVVVVALDPDSALPADAFYLTERLRSSARTGAVLRAAADDPDGDPLVAGWTSFATSRAALLARIRGESGRFGVESALLGILAEEGAELIADPVFDDPAAGLMRLAAIRAGRPEISSLVLLESVDDLLTRSLATLDRPRTASELVGFAAAELGATIHVEIAGTPSPAQPQDPELGDHIGPRTTIVAYRPSACGAGPLADLAADAAAGETIAIAVPMREGLPVAVAAERLARELGALGVDLDGGADLALLPRPLFDCELAHLLGRAPTPRAGEAETLRRAASAPDGPSGVPDRHPVIPLAR